MTTHKMKTKVFFVIDESGSMSPQADDVRGGFNEYIKTLREEKGDADIEVSAAAFHTQVRPIFSHLPLEEVPKLDKKNYNPGGGTALYDAIGFGLNEIREKEMEDSWCQKCKRHHKGANPYGSPKQVKYLFIIMTDGEENSSRTFRKKDVIEKIERREKNGNWTFVYIGANQDAMAEGGAIGVGAYNTFTYNPAQTAGTLRAMAVTTAGYANSAATNTANFAASTYGGATPDWDASKTATAPSAPITVTGPITTGAILTNDTTGQSTSTTPKRTKGGNTKKV